MKYGLERDKENEILESMRNDSNMPEDFIENEHDDWNIYQWRDEMMKKDFAFIC